MPSIIETINSLNDDLISPEAKEQLIAEATALESKKNQFYTRAKKAEGFTLNKETNQWEKKEVKPKATPLKEDKKPQETPAYSLADIRVLNKVHDDDVERVEKFAKAEGVSIAEAMKNDDLKAILRDREEKRKSAEAANTGGGRRGTSSSSPAKILEEAQKGNYPTDDAGIQKLVEAEMAAKKAAARKD